MAALRIPPGMNRSFDFENFSFMKTDINYQRESSKDTISENYRNCSFKVFGYDIDKRVLGTARQNAKDAGVADYIDFHSRDFSEFSSNRKYGVVITNPPYGVRLLEKAQAEDLIKSMGKTFSNMPDWSVYILSALNGVEMLFGKRATKRRKLFNGNIQTGYYQFLGERPPN